MPASNRTILLPPIEAPQDLSLKTVSEAFSLFPELVFAQHWRPTPEAEFQPATLKAAWCPDFLHLFATFTDHDIVVLENHSSRSRLAVGDVFQVFLGRPEANDYLEIHVTPGNQTQVLGWTQQRFKSFLDGGTSLDEILLDSEHPPLSKTWVEEENARWTAYLRIPAETARPGKDRFAPGIIVEGAFCRYDASPGAPTPVVSSTSEFPEKPQFHSDRHWHRLKLKLEPETERPPKNRAE